jgi:hypothetical protein
MAFPAVGEAATLEASVRRTFPARQETAAPPCFFARVCRQRAAIEKSGRSVCRECAATRVHGHEYPLRDPEAEPLYLTGRVASEALDMIEEARLGARRGLRGDSWG